jgi:hypothetical protein
MIPIDKIDPIMTIRKKITIVKILKEAVNN